jgi:hypothetical protein
VSTDLSRYLVSRNWDQDNLALEGWQGTPDEANAPALLRFASARKPSLLRALLDFGVRPVGKNMGFGVGKLHIDKPELGLWGFAMVGPLLAAGWNPYPDPSRPGLMTALVQMAIVQVERWKKTDRSVDPIVDACLGAAAMLCQTRWPRHRADAVEALLLAATMTRFPDRLALGLVELGLDPPPGELERLRQATAKSDRWREGDPLAPRLAAALEKRVLDTLPSSSVSPRPMRI